MSVRKQQDDIGYGYGVILWGAAITELEIPEVGYYRRAQPAGWVLPGGERTTNRQKALRAAMAIRDEFIRLNRRPERFINPHNALRAA